MTLNSLQHFKQSNGSLSKYYIINSKISPLLGEIYLLICLCIYCGRAGFDPWAGKICWRRERVSTPVFWPGEFHGLDCKESDTTE